jgi:hypothetical protein
MDTFKKIINIDSTDFTLIIDYNVEDQQELYFNFYLLFPNIDTDTHTLTDTDTLIDSDKILALIHISIKEGIIIIERLANNVYYKEHSTSLFKGFGLKLWCFSIKYLLGRGYIALDDKIILEPAGNDKLKKYYTNLGFQPTSIKKSNSKFLKLSVNEFLLNC